ncbi:PaaI family thioesterase [Paludifilum halophilum]|nr:hotdog fold thioesterase [Paludifilum halophilum]
MGLPTENTMIERLGIESLKLSPERVVMKMPVDSRVHQPYGILHGGASAALAETAASIGAWLHCDTEKEIPVGLEINANHIRSKRDGYVVAEAIPLHRGRSTMVWEIKIRDEEEKLISASRCTMAIVPNKK